MWAKTEEMSAEQSEEILTNGEQATKTLFPVGVLIQNAIVDFMLYILIDMITKVQLKEASSDPERRSIWMFEGAVLASLSLCLHLFVHTPYLLAYLTVLTFLYTQLLGRVNFRYLWQMVSTEWDVFEQHNESQQRLQEMVRAQQQQQQQPIQSPMFMQSPPPGFTAPPIGWTPQSLNSHNPDIMLPAEAWYPADSEKARLHPRPHAPSPMAQQLRFRGPVSGSHPFSPSIHNRPNHQNCIRPNTNFSANSSANSLRRRPLHSYLESPAEPVTSIRSRFMTALGMNPFVDKPLGLPNNGKNLCFVNSVIQCLAHTPNITECLMSFKPSELSTNDAESALLSSTIDLIRKLQVTPGSSEIGIADTEEWRSCASSLPGSIVSHPLQEQQQQDVAEFFMWFLGSLHGALNVSQRNKQDRNGSLSQKDLQQQYIDGPRFTSSALETLRFIYGDLNSQKINELKADCRKQIENSNGVEDSYAEALQRLSDLEWLSYKERNNSAVDDLFSGQLIESQQCLACNRKTVSNQAFNILSLPLVDPRSFNGLVYLEDCFGKFGKVEDLYGPDGLRCVCCNQKREPVRGPSSSEVSLDIGQSPVLPNGDPALTRQAKRKRLLYSDSNVPRTPLGQNVMSPIHGGKDGFSDSGFMDSVFKTSTPVHSQNSPVKLTDGQRRTLLRQMPACLVVQLMRFSYHNGSVGKDHRPVSIPINDLDLTSLIVDTVMHREDLTALNSSYHYELYAVCLHLGAEATTTGHNVTYAKVARANNTWFRFDDETVTAVNMDYEINTRQIRENAYLLFFRKKGV